MRCLLCFPSSQKQDIYNNEEKTKIVYPRKKLFFIDDVESADTKGELALATILNSEFRIPNYSKEIVAFGEVGDAVGEVGVGFAVAGDAAAEPRDNMLCVEVIEGAEEWTVGGGQFENDHAASWFKYAQHLAETFFQIHKVADTKGTGDGVESLILERKVFCIGNHVCSCRGFLSGYSQHLIRQINSCNRTTLFLQFNNHIASATGHVQYRAIQSSHSMPPPAAVEAEGHDAVQPVIVVSYLIEVVGHITRLDKDRWLLYCTPRRKSVPTQKY